MNKLTKITCVALASTGLALAAAQAQAAPKMEKCYGISKAGKNDCGGAKTGHSCQGHATKSGDKYDWLLVPEGLCDKIVDGSTKPGDDASQSDDNTSQSDDNSSQSDDD